MKLSCVQRSWPRLNSSVNWYGIFILIFSLLQVSATGVHLASTFFSPGFGPHPALDGEIFWNMFSSCKHSIKSRPFVLSDFLIEFLLEQNYLAGFFWLSTHFQLFSFSYHPVQQAHKNDFFVVIFMLFFIIFYLFKLNFLRLKRVKMLMTVTIFVMNDDDDWCQWNLGDNWLRLLPLMTPPLKF